MNAIIQFVGVGVCAPVLGSPAQGVARGLRASRDPANASDRPSCAIRVRGIGAGCPRCPRPSSAAAWLREMASQRDAAHEGPTSVNVYVAIP